MTLVSIMALATYFLPVIVGREEGVGFRWGVVDLRQTETVGERQSLLIDTCPTYYINILIGSTMRKGFLQ